MKNKMFVVGVLVAFVGVFALLYSMSPKVEKPTSSAPVSQESKPELGAKPIHQFHNYFYGNPSAKVVVVEFFDPECEACRQVHPIVKKLISEYGDKVKFVHRYMPLHGNSIYASAALEEARELKKYDEALDKLFEQQPMWGDHHNPRADLIPEYLKEVGIPKEKLDKDYLLKKHQAKITQDMEEGRALGVRYTPTFFVNGQILDEIGDAPIRTAIEAALKANP